ncbi:hypothetical protein ACHAXR_005152 [Thalassiosira sp. AJA248-18]
MITHLQDILAFARQFIPSPITFFKTYQFSPADLAIGRDARLLIAPSYSSSSPPHGNHGPLSTILTTIDILSYNINNVAALSPTRRRRILRAIFSSGADVVLLQETNPAWEELLRKEDSIALQFRYNHFQHPSVTDRAAGGIAILSQYPLDNVRVLDFTKDIDGSVFPALTCEVNIPIESSERSSLYHNTTVTINIANVHLRPPVELDGSAWLDTARKTEPIRINEVKELIQKTASTKPGGILKNEQPLDIIAGDFNEGDKAGAISYLTSLGYIDALQKYVPISMKAIKQEQYHILQV